MENIIKEIFISIKEKISSPLTRYFIISWCLWNYKVVYFILFQDQKVFFDVYDITKYDYLLFNNFYDVWYIGLLFFLILPFISVLFFIYVFPNIDNFFKEHFIEKKKNTDKLDYDYKFSIREKEDELNKKVLDFLEQEEKVLDEEEKIIEKKNKIKSEKDKNLTQEEKWDKEFIIFINNKNSDNFSKFSSIIYKNNGFNYDNENGVNSEVIAFFDSYGLLDIKQVKRYTNSLELSFSLTEKGKYFWKNYQEKNTKTLLF